MILLAVLYQNFSLQCVSFSVLHQPPSSSSQESGESGSSVCQQRVLIPTRRVVSTQGSTVKGRLVTKQPGVYTLVFDNSSSRWDIFGTVFTIEYKSQGCLWVLLPNMHMNFFLDALRPKWLEAHFKWWSCLLITELFYIFIMQHTYIYRYTAKKITYSLRLLEQADGDSLSRQPLQPATSNPWSLPHFSGGGLYLVNSWNYILTSGSSQWNCLQRDKKIYFNSHEESSPPVSCSYLKL